MKLMDWNIEELTGYKPVTTFYTDFSIADGYGIAGIKDTCKRVFEAWKDDVEFLTEFVMVLNWKSWEHYDSGHKEISDLYADLFYKYRDWCLKNLKGDDLTYFFETTD